MINQCAKFEVYTFTHYEDKKGDKKNVKLGWFERLGVTQVHRQHMFSQFDTIPECDRHTNTQRQRIPCKHSIAR